MHSAASAGEWDGEVAERLLREAGVVVHPGTFYGIGEAGPGGGQFAWTGG